MFMYECIYKYILNFKIHEPNIDETEREIDNQNLSWNIAKMFLQ